MSDNEEVVPSGRRTRSGRVSKTPKKVAVAAAPTTRRTKKKLVVEASDEEEQPLAKIKETPKIEEEEDKITGIEALKNAVDEEMSKLAAEVIQEEEEEIEAEKEVEETETEKEEDKMDISNGSVEEETNLDDFANDFGDGGESDGSVEQTIAQEIEQIVAEEAKEVEKVDEPEEAVETVDNNDVDKTSDNEEVTERDEDDKAVDNEKVEKTAENDEVESMDCDNFDKSNEDSNDKAVEKVEEDKKSVKDENGLDNFSDTDIMECSESNKENGEPDAENISEDELPGVPVAKVPETEEVSDEELPGPKRAELPADTEVVSEDELPTVKKEGTKRKLEEGDYDPTSPTSEGEAPPKKPAIEPTVEKEKEKSPKPPKKLPELDKYWKAVNDDPTDFTGWTYLLQYVDQENDMEAAREAYDAFLSHYPYCYGYWRKYADYEKRKGNKKKCEEVFERGLKSIPLSVDLWIHYLTYVRTTKADDEEYIRSQFERALTACGLEFRSDRLWDSYIKWETEAKRLQNVTAIYDRLLATPTQGYTSHFDNFQEHIANNSPNKVVEVDEFLALRKEVRHILKHDNPEPSADSDAPPGDEESSKLISSDEETKSIRERIVSIRRKIHKNTVSAVTARWNYEEGIKRPYFHVKPLERCQLKNWQDYLDYEIEHGDRVRAIVLFERCLIACALYEEFWLKFVHYLEGLKDPELQPKIRDVYERACTIHHLKKPNLHLQWAMFEECVGNAARAAEILVNLEKSVPNVLQVAYRRINLERRRSDNEKCIQLYEHYINTSKNKVISSNISIKYSRFCLKIMKDLEKAQEVLKSAIAKDGNNPRLYLQLIDLTLQKENVGEAEIVELIDLFLNKEGADADQKVLFAQRKVEFLEDFGSDIQSVQAAQDQHQKLLKSSKENVKKKESKSAEPSSSKKDKNATQASSQGASYGNYSYGNSSGQTSYPYSGGQQGQYGYSQYGQGDQYQYQNWQYPQGGYGNYNQWGSYGGGYGY